MLKKLCTATLLLVLLALQTKAANDNKLASDYLFWLWNRDLPDHLITSNPEQKLVLRQKAKLLIDNYLKSGIDLGQATVQRTHSEEVFGTGNRVLLVIYQANGTNWDDVVLYLDKATNKIIDIGDVANTFTMNQANSGRNYTNRSTLPYIFDKKAITRQTLIGECRTLIRLANARRIDSFCTRVLYTGGDTLKRKNRAEACNPAIAKDKTYCAAVMDDLTGYITNPEDFDIDYITPEGKTTEIGLFCRQTKNRKKLHYTIVANKLLLSGVN